MRYAIAAAATLLLASGAWAESGLMLTAELVRVVDGDTLVVNVPGWPDIVGRGISVRVAGCDTPELRDKRPEVRAAALRAKAAVAALFAGVREVRLVNVRRGKYFRLVATVMAPGGRPLADMLIEAGLARPYPQ